MSLDNFGSKVFWKFSLTDTAGKLTGSMDGDIVDSTRTGDHIKFHAYDKNGGTANLDATLTLR